MNIWVVKTGEPLPIDGDNIRLFRAGIISNFLSERGHQVTWWNADFDHQNKRLRNLKNDSINLNRNLKVNFLKSRGYKKSISINRILDHIDLARDFTKRAPLLERPDIIFCAFPTIDLASHVVDFGRNHNIPVIIDIRDLWPDIFIERIIPFKLPKSLNRLILFPFSIKVQKLLSRTTAITAVSPQMLDWALSKVKSRSIQSKVIPFAYFSKDISQAEYEIAYRSLQQLSIFATKPKLRICLFATFNNSFDIETIINASARYNQSEVQFIICGKGEQLQHYIELSKGLNNIFFPGWVNNNAIKTIMKHSDIGLAPYVDSVGFKYNLTNKPIEYLSAGLPVLTCVDGYLRTLVEKNECGYYYKIKSVDSLQEVLNQILKKPSELARYKENAKLLFQDKFEGESNYEKLIEFFKNLIQNHINGC